MASSIGTAQFIVDQTGLGSQLSFRKMFGEFALYLNGKVVALVCDDQLFLKPTDEGGALLQEVKLALPYPGAKYHYLLANELDDPDFLREVMLATANALPEPRPKKVATKESSYGKSRRARK